ncbi:cAMP-binding domain of CRP or a regulatory subunit of cAMP-dependent protein kinases [Mucilaginibacter pineti]|uniref:cAMP-binding domain of CRP or a regulatory subunit of cAMP-dependent protein kinases n=1 Tax=Mucilaginibacter pineti TaxID=1391627 RepID=A0A1G7IJB0_9SPHI|nr:cyclic nucleotide-binding domain-containing protein [Mucilaginibacter pineti]SDF12614.1 cAMP-binding domain of CRP or a regulatory subunit of cAMP-dependent protein kinases [Mucilaginibacter pineti]
MRDNDEIIRRLFKILCSYKEQPTALHDFLKVVMPAGLKPQREKLFEHNDIVTNAIFVSDGHVAVYGFDGQGDRQLLSLLGKDSIIAGKSFMEQSPSEFELVALPGAYLATISHDHMDYIYANFPDAEELARLIMAANQEKAEKRLHLLKRDAETVILDFYRTNPEFLKTNLLLDIDLASYLLISEKTLRNVRMKLFRDGRLQSADLSNG